jgi:uncharacterized membrane protein YqjE
MPVPGPADTGASPEPSLFASIRTFWRVLIASLYTRLDLFTTELGEHAYRLMYLVIAGILGLLSLQAAFFFFMLWIIASVWETPYRLVVIGGICGVYLLAAVILLLIARKMIVDRPRFLGQTLDELRRDAEGLQAALKPAPGENHP